MLTAGLVGVNAVCATIFLYCLYRYSRSQPLPYLFISLSIAYFVIVVGIGYTRQGVAAALAMLGLTYLRKQKVFSFISCVAIGCGFHTSAIINVLLLVSLKLKYLGKFTSLIFKLSVLISISYFMYISLNSDSRISYYINNYVSSDHYQSGGGFLRSLFTLLAGGLLVMYRRSWLKKYDDYHLLFPYAWAALALTISSIFYSTASDRIGLYLIPFQLTIMSRLPDLQSSQQKMNICRILVVVMYFIYFYTWINLGNYAKELWIPYTWVFS